LIVIKFPRQLYQTVVLFCIPKKVEVVERLANKDVEESKMHDLFLAEVVECMLSLNVVLVEMRPPAVLFPAMSKKFVPRGGDKALTQTVAFLNTVRRYRSQSVSRVLESVQKLIFFLLEDLKDV
jgi:hypothetical protein